MVTRRPAEGTARLGDKIFSEGQFVDDDGTVIQTYAVQLGKASQFSWPMELPVIVKGCPARYAIEECGTIRPQQAPKDSATRTAPSSGIPVKE